jgi:hypothetical protein
MCLLRGTKRVSLHTIHDNVLFQTLPWDSTSVSPVSVIPSMLLTQAHLHVALSGRNKRAKPGNPPKSQVLLEIGARWVEKDFPFFILQSSKDSFQQDNTVTHFCLSRILTFIRVCTVRKDSWRLHLTFHTSILKPDRVKICHSMKMHYECIQNIINH